MLKESLCKKISVILITMLICASIFNVGSFAFVEGYDSAVTLSGSVTDYIESSAQNDWYQFTLSSEQVPTPYSITLQIPDECIYNFDLRYRAADSESRPSIVANETVTTATRNRRMTGVLTEAGTYFIRIYSQDGSTDSLNYYKLTASYSQSGTYSLSFGSSLPTAEATDWSICADIAGNCVYGNYFKNSTTGRTYKNAYVFVTSDYESDYENNYENNVKATPEKTAIAADYIYSGDVMLNPKFEVETNKIYDIEDLMRFVLGYGQPVIFYLDCSEVSLDVLKKYVILERVNLANNTITYYYPTSGSRVTVDYDEFLTNGIAYSGLTLRYAGTNIVQTNERTKNQATFN